MSKGDARIDAYIKKAPDFAKPILIHFREVVHEVCPDVEETMKWNTPNFMYRGSLLCGMAAFKQHCRLIFWKGELIKGPKGENASVESIGKPAQLSDLPSRKVLTTYIKQGMKLNEQGVKLSMARPVRNKADAKTPADLLAALKKDKKALQAFEALTPSHRREYISWIEEAKRDETRQRRIAQTVEWVAEGKTRHWKYV
jgi:uncharacterized protein YdeI (YjbR/CyaY-like superfamily)